MRISDWSSDVCSSDLFGAAGETAVEMFFSMPLGGRTDFSSSLRHDGAGLSATSALQKDPPFGEGWGYRASAATGQFDRFNGRLQLNTRFGEFEIESASCRERVCQ